MTRIRERIVMADRLSDSSVREIRGYLKLRKVSDQQTIEIIESDDYGMCLFLDGILQFAEGDEVLYHRMLCDLSGLVGAGGLVGQRALVLGGGDGCAASELCSRWGVKRCDVVDHDPTLVALFREKEVARYFKSLGRVSADALHVHVRDAYEFLADFGGMGDVWSTIVVDLTDSWIESQDRMLELIGLVRRRLSKDGIISVQAGAAALLANNTISLIAEHGFRAITCESLRVPSFGEDWAFLKGMRSDVAI